ncbi:MAG: ribbon-helix-helix protein, CopG family [Chloroflexota bacterium]
MAKVLVSLDNQLLERLDREAAAREMSRSALIAELTAKELGEPVGPGAAPSVHRADERLRKLFAEAPRTPEFLEDSTKTFRDMRDSR